jgi:succinate dehydrogenase/fumarate reductase flavoprotein subunit
VAKLSHAGVREPLWRKKLVEKMNLRDRSRLALTLERYNRFCNTGKDDDFGRPADTLAALAMPPFYAIPAYPCLLNTQGGPKRNARTQVLDSWDPPYRGSMQRASSDRWGFMYQSGGNLGECLAFGRVAGLHAAQETAMPSSSA